MMAILVELTDTIVKRILPSVIEEVRIEISALVLKMLLGIVISSTMIFSIFQIAVYYMTWLRPAHGESFYPFWIFGLSILFCLTALYFLFKVKTNEKIVSPSSKDDAASLLLIFSQGFLSGFNSKGEDHDVK